jgi:hypothetical protein
MSDYEFTFSLRIRHPDIDPVEITQALGIEPQHTWKAGDPRRGSTGEALEGRYRESYWMGRLMEDPQLSTSDLTSVEAVLLQTLTQLRRSQDFLSRLSKGGGEAELHVSLFTRKNFQLNMSADSLTLLTRLGLGIALEVNSQVVAAPDAPPPN